MAMVTGGRTIFERHPRVTIAVTIVVGLCGALVVAERVAAWCNTAGERAGRVRHVLLREQPPGVSYSPVPSAAYLKAVRPAAAVQHRLRTDDLGYIEPSLVHQEADWTVVFLGGSTTECLYVDERRRFPYLVGRLLEAGRPGLAVNSVNAGVPGNDSLHSLTVLVNKIVPLRPDAVVIMHNINDLAVLVHAGTYWNQLPTRAPVVREDLAYGLRVIAREIKNLLVANLYVGARKAWQRLARREAAGPDEFRGARGPFTGDPDALTREFAGNLKALVGVCRARGITAVLMTMPSRLTTDPDPEVRAGMGNLPGELLDDYETMRGLFESFNETIRRVGAQEDVTVIDLARAVPPRMRQIYDVVHLTEAGSELAAGVIAEGLAPLLPAPGTGVR